MKTKILVVEDSGPMRSLITAALEEHLDVDVYEAENGFAALKLIPDNQFKVIVTDINMPDINGLELIVFLRQHPNFKDVPILIISTEAGEEDRRRGLEIGANGYLVKPFTEGQLVETVQKFLV
ncbi:MAG TPA: response regulator [Acidobacteriota bacterium]|nr:response regulator [Acidobacteriota bacterium]HNT16520.1 response regulator [Acidobacteriota bacterium]HPA26032.1 response regulator [Acidobacteriota bacterium]HQO18995.1 response regulator [Acidobacteriota bacterium]HQQ45888.1 response regulator [Acidobacteriota bacterium]